MARRFSPRRAYASVHATHKRCAEWLVHHSQDRRNVSQRLVSHLSDGARFRRPHSYGAARHHAADGNADACDQPGALQLRLDGQPVATPVSFTAVVGIVRNLDAPAQTSGSTAYEFSSWSDGGAATHDISTPAVNTTYTATYRATTGAGTGLSATYFDNSNFTGASVARVDPAVDFTWGSGSPGAGIGADTFSVRWIGQVQPQFSETYRFYTVSDDGVRLWVNGVQLVNRWTDHPAVEDSGTIALTAGQRYDIRMEFYENTGAATARLLWSSPSTPKAVIPSARLFASVAPPPPPPPPSGAVQINFQPAGAPVPFGIPG